MSKYKKTIFNNGILSMNITKRAVRYSNSPLLVFYLITLILKAASTHKFPQ